MIKKSLILCGVLVALVNCSSDKKDNVVKTVPSDTPTEIIDTKGNVVDVIDPSKDTTKPQEKTPTAEELTKGVWTEIGFTKDFLMAELMGSDVCALGEKQYVGCFFAAQELSPSVYGPGTVLVVNGQSNAELLGNKIKDLGNFAVYEAKKPTFDTEDKSAVSAYNKRQNDFFKETVKALVEQYKTKLANMPEVQTVLNNYKVKFPEVTKAIQAAAKIKDKEAFDKARADLNTLIADVNAAKKVLDESIFAEYVSIIDAAFAKMPEADRALAASESYGTYLRHSADGHARLALNPRLEAQLAEQISGPQTFGIGVQIMSNDVGIFVDPIEGSPAQAAGLLANDRIVAVEGKEYTTNLDEAIVAIKGPRDTEVNITVERWDTKEQKVVAVKRAPIQQKSYKLSKKVVNGKTVGVLSLATFMDDTMSAAVREYVKNNDSSVEGWIMDLRNNPGGLVTEAVGMSSIFLPNGSAVLSNSTEEDLDTPIAATTEFTSAEPVTQKGLIILINGRSASASEIVSGVLQEYKRAVVVGQRSFGKGTMQRSGYEFHPDIPEYRVWDNFDVQVGSLMGPQIVSMVTFYKTVGRYFFPSGRTPEWVGVSPDIEVASNPEVTEMFAAREQDLIPFSFGDTGAPWVQTRAEMMTEIKTCVNTSGASTKSWSGVESKKPFAINYQMLYSYDALKCM